MGSMSIQNTKVLRGGKEISETYRSTTIMQEFVVSFIALESQLIG